MKIGNNIDSKQVDVASRPTNGARPSSAGSPEVANGTPVDKVELSATSRNIAGSDRTEQPVRTEKVNDIRAAIQEGKFHVSAEIVADKMINAAAELIETMASGKAQ